MELHQWRPGGSTEAWQQEKAVGKGGRRLPVQALVAAAADGGSQAVLLHARWHDPDGGFGLVPVTDGVRTGASGRETQQTSRR